MSAVLQLLLSSGWGAKNKDQCDSWTCMTWTYQRITQTRDDRSNIRYDVQANYSALNEKSIRVAVLADRCNRTVIFVDPRNESECNICKTSARDISKLMPILVATGRRRFLGHILRLPATRPASLALEMDPRRLQKEGWKTNEDMARYAERRFGDDGCGPEWRERYC